MLTGAKGAGEVALPAGVAWTMAIALLSLAGLTRDRSDLSQSRFNLLLPTLTAVASLCSPLTLVWVDLGSSHVSICSDIRDASGVLRGKQGSSSSVCSKPRTP